MVISVAVSVPMASVRGVRRAVLMSEVRPSHHNSSAAMGIDQVIPTVSGADSFVILRRSRPVIPYCRRRFGDGISCDVAG